MSYFKDPKDKVKAPSAAPQEAGPAQANEAGIPVDGFQQVLEMLQVADPAFRESLLRRLAARDRELARSLRADLGI
jgi:hypothetical protein